MSTHAHVGTHGTSNSPEVKINENLMLSFLFHYNEIIITDCYPWPLLTHENKKKKIFDKTKFNYD